MISRRIRHHCSGSSLKRIFAAFANIQPSVLHRFEQNRLGVRRQTFPFPDEGRSGIGPWQTEFAQVSFAPAASGKLLFLATSRGCPRFTMGCSLNSASRAFAANALLMPEGVSVGSRRPHPVPEARFRPTVCFSIQLFGHLFSTIPLDEAYVFRF